MGKLIALELFNFKSYKGHHRMEFGDSYFTSIVGPNGSGKSNSMDAISFLLGIKSSHLRSAHLRELIYRGRVLKQSKIDANGDVEGLANGRANGDATNGHAHTQAGASRDPDEDVDTQASTLRNDPQTAWVMAVYEDDAGEEQRWKRSITSSGQSEYRINNRVVSAKQYNEALEAENILIKARNFLVFQGDIEQIANQDPKDLTRLIEQISGSLEYKNEYDRLKAEKERADSEQLLKLRDRRDINGEIKQYQEQKQELDKFENVRDEKDEAIVTHALWKLFHFQRTIEESTAEIQKHQDELKEFRRNVQKFEEKLEAAKREQAKVGRDVSKYEREIKRKDKAVEEKENALVPIDEKLSLANAKLGKYQHIIAEISQERDAQQSTLEQLQKNLTKTEKNQQRWEAEWRAQQQQAGRELTEDDMHEYQNLRGEVYRRSGNDQSKVDNITRQLKTNEETVNSLKSKVDGAQAHVDNLNAELESLSGRQADVSRITAEAITEIAAKKKSINTLASERERTHQKRRELDEKLMEVLRKLAEAVDVQRETRKDAEQRETVAQMKRLYPGVKGMVHQVCKPKQKKYELAMVTALGRHWDAVVVDTEKTAKECMLYLKDKRAGQMTFVPLDSIIAQRPNDTLRGMHPGMRLAIDVIDFDTGLERAMIYACGTAIVTDTLKIARHLCYEKHVEAKAVALDGTVIHKGGNMTGGQTSDRKRHFEEAEVENLRTLAQKFRADIDALPKGHKREQEEEQLQSELTGLEATLKYAQDEGKTLQRNTESKTKELAFTQRQLTESRPKYEEQASGLQTLREDLQQHNTAIAEVEDDVFGAFCQRLGYASVREYEAQQGALQQEAQQKNTEFKTQINRLRNQIAFETQRVDATNARIAVNEKSSARDVDLVARLEQEREEIAREMDVLNAEVEQLSEKLAELREQSDERGKVVSEARAELQKRSKSVDKTLKHVSAHEAEVEKATAERYGTLRRCKVDNIAVPLARGSRKIEALPMEGAILEEEEDDDAMDVDGDEGGVKTNDYGIVVDFDALDDDLKEDGSEDCGVTLVDKIASIQAQLEKMAPNMRSAERLEATSERLKATERDFTSSRTAARTVGKAFDEIKQKRQDLFNKAFAHIGEQIVPVYKELTATPAFPIGGTASLDVEEDDEPYLGGIKYSAMPPMKRYREMEHLSGGEKTMAALALLFAVHTYAPSPFFVLDEVDAALDHANTTQLARYVQNHAAPGMQFVVISLKTGLFQQSEALVGIMRDQGLNSSRALTLDLRRYQAV